MTSSEYGWLADKNAEGQPALLFFGVPRLSDLEQDVLNAVSFDLKTGEISTHGISLDGEFDWDRALQDKHPTPWHYAVVPLPRHLHEAIDDGVHVDDLHDWILDSNFVVHAGNAYWMNADGEVETS